MSETGDGEKAEKLPLHLLTIETVLADLISGRSVRAEPDHLFELNNDDQRAILDWYRRNRPKWTANLTGPDCEAIVAAVGKKVPAVQKASGASASSTKRIGLAKVVAHRFAGVHAYGSLADQPEHFIFEPAKPISLFEGWNGAGKTSLLNAIIWCLTGKLLRPQRPPEEGTEDFALHVDQDDETTTEHAISPVTPMPDGTVWKPGADAGPVPADTWVELTFVDPDGAELPSIRRSQSRKPSGKLTESEPDLSVLGIDLVSARIGSTMPGLLPFLQVGSASELGLAVAKLTGLADLVDLAKHAGKAQARISGQMKKEIQADIDSTKKTFDQALSDVSDQIEAFPGLASDKPLPTYEAGVLQDAKDAKTRFTTLKADALAAAKAVLGDRFDPQKASDRQNLETQIAPALLALAKVTALPSIGRLIGLKLDGQVVSEVEALLGDLRKQALTLSALAENPTLARRTQLYARVANWIHEHGHGEDEKCSVCRAPLEGVIDPETDISVTEHMRRVRSDRETVSKTISEWAGFWTGKLARDLPSALQSELQRDLPASPGALLRQGLVDDLFATDPFAGSLSILKAGTSVVADAEVAKLTPMSPENALDLPASIVELAPKLALAVRRIERALDFARWYEAHGDELATATAAIRNGAEGAPGDALQPKLKKLDEIVRGTSPISKAITSADKLVETLITRDEKRSKIANCDAAAAALGEIFKIGTLAQAQVGNLQIQLHERSIYWRDLIFRNATSSAPALQQTEMSGNGIIEIAMGNEGVRAPAQHVTNASALRATLFGFFLAFREYALQTRGGLELLVLDDPQEMLDSDNRQRLAKALVVLANDGAQIIVSTHDRNFARSIVSEARPSDLVEHRSIHPVNTSRMTLATSLAVEELDRKRNAFLSALDSSAEAQDYANQARIFLEARMGDLFDDPVYPAHATSTKSPSLFSLYDRLRGLVAAKSNELFKSPVLVSFASDPALAPGADTRQVLNTSHHDKASLSYVDVKAVDLDLRRLRASVEEVHKEFRLYRWREPLTPQPKASNVTPLRANKGPTFEIPLYQDIAAFTRHLPEGGDQATSDDSVSSEWFEDKAFFYVRHDTLGFAVPAGSIVIVERASTVGKDHNLVVARQGEHVYARRLLRPKNGDGLSLAAEMPDPRKSRPTLRFEDSKIEIHRVVGVVFSDLPPPAGRDEAVEVEIVPQLNGVEVAYRVREESAVPLALPGQIILGGKQVGANELDQMEGTLVAVTLDDGSSIFKRVGPRLAKGLGYLRQFESIGGLGGSTVVAMEQVQRGADVPLMAYARPVIAVIYNP